MQTSGAEAVPDWDADCVFVGLFTLINAEAYWNGWRLTLAVPNWIEQLVMHWCRGNALKLKHCSVRKFCILVPVRVIVAVALKIIVREIPWDDEGVLIVMTGLSDTFAGTYELY